ncbi:hypothetical protein JCM14076_19290 [Methylosoma difficile]
MENLLPILQNQLADWLVLAQANTLFVAAVAGTVWMLTSILYSIRIGGLKRLLGKNERSLQQSQASLVEANQSLQQLQADLAQSVDAAAQANAAKDQEQQRADQLHAQLVQRNQQLAGSIQALAMGLDIGERPAPVTEDIQAEAVWQQHSRVIEQIVTALQTEIAAKNEWQSNSQNESAKRAALEAQVLPLQATMAEQAQQIEALAAKLDQQTSAYLALQQQSAEQEALHQSQQQQSEAAFAQLIADHQADVQRLQALEQQANESAASAEQLQQSQAALADKDALIARLRVQLEEATAAKPVSVVAPVPVVPEVIDTPVEKVVMSAPETITPVEQPVEPLSEESPRQTSLGLLKGLFSKTSQTPELPEQEIVPVDVVADPIPEPVKEEAPEPEQAEAPVKESAFGFVKNIFAKTAEPAEEAHVAPEPEQVVEEEVVEPAAKANALGFMKNVFAKPAKPAKSVMESEVNETPVVAAPEPVVDAPAVKSEPFGFMKNLFAKPVAEVEPQALPEPEPVVEQTEPTGMAFMKNIFAKNTSPAEREPPVVELSVPDEPIENKPFGFVKQWLGKTEATPELIEPEPVVVEEEKSANLAGQLKGFYSKLTAKKD